MAALEPVTKVRKRDGQLVDFDLEKTVEAIYAAARATGEFGKEEAEKLSQSVRRILNKKFDGLKIPTVEEIQDVVEEVLARKGWYQTAKAYILYRHKRAELRRVKLLLDKTTKLINDYIQQADWRVKENANMAYSLQGLNNHIASSVVARYWLQEIYPPKIAQAHIDADFHLHDLSFLGSYCVGWDLYDLLVEGFKGVPGKIQSRPAKHFRVALGQIVNFLYTMQGEAAGAQALSNFDTLLAPFIAYDQLDYPAVKQSIQEFLYNMNVPTRVGFQSPFTNLTFDLTVPADLAVQPVIIAGQPQPKKYRQFQKEMDMLNRAFAEVMLEGDARGRVFSFPIPTYNVTKDFNWDNPTLEPVFEMSAKYGIPYWANFVNSDMKPTDVRSMCPIAGNEKVLIKSKRGRNLEYCSIKSVCESEVKDNRYEVFSDGKFIKGRFNKFKNQRMIKVILENGHELKQSTQHLNYVMEKPNSIVKEMKGEELQTGMYLPYSLKEHEGKGGSQELGYFIGAYAGDGSLDGDTSVIFSLENERKKEVIKRLQKTAQDLFGAHYSTKKHPVTKLFTLKIHSRAAVGLCRDFVADKKRNKYYRARVFGMSSEFRKGVIKGHYATNGGNRHRIYTSSKKMVEALNMLTATVGTTTSIYKDSREGRLSEAPNYAVLVYQLNRKNYGRFWFKKDKKLWVKIKQIKKTHGATAYCFEAENSRPVFTVGTTGILTHNCRLRLRLDELIKRGGGLFGANALTGSIGVVTINMARIGYLAKSKQSFLNRVGRMMDLAKDALEIKRKVVERFTERGLYPYSQFYLRGNKERLGSYWGGHFSTIGLNGLNEGLMNLMKTNIGSPAGRKFSEEVLDYMRQTLVDYQKKTGNLYNLEATPAEGASYRLARIDKKKYHDIVVANDRQVKQGAAPFYTNSSQLPVDFDGDVFRALKLQDNLQGKYTGGTVFHIFLGERLASGQEAKALIKKVVNNFSLPYVSLTPTFSICPEHGYLKGEKKKCPRCGALCETYSRVVGYLRPVSQWNAGKQAEFKKRKEFKIK